MHIIYLVIFRNGFKWEKCKTGAFSQIGFWTPLYCVWKHLQWRLELLVVGIFKALATEPCNLSASTALAPSQITFITRLVSNQSSGKRVTVSNEIAMKYCLDAGRKKPKSYRSALGFCQFYMCYYIKRLIDLIRASCTSKFLAVAKISIQRYQPPLQDLDSGCPTRRCFLTSILCA